MRKTKVSYDLDEIAEYIVSLEKRAYLGCNFRENLRIAGAVDALEKLQLITKERARYIRSLAEVKG